jgi:hypothetical protein
MSGQKKNNMRKAYIILFTSLIAAASNGQSLQRVVFNSTGGSISSPGSPKMTLSVGEALVGSASGSGINLGQGFLGGSKTVTASPSGVQEITSENTTVYPNPFSSVVRINSDADNIHVSVFNIVGQEVYSGAYQTEGINLSYLTSGMYMVQASSNNKIISTTKLLKQ